MIMRDLIGYASNPPAVRWPGGAGLAVNFVMNYEEGSEYSIGAGDGRSETALIEINAPRVPQGDRDLASESMYEYGARVGFWRLFRMFRSRELPMTIFAAAQALELNPEVAAALAATDWDFVAHGHRWIEHYRLSEDEERDHIGRAYDDISRLTGRAPQGWYCRYSPSEHTRRLVVEHGGYFYDSDAYNDEVPYWTEVEGRSHLIVPYSLVTNDAKLLAGGGVESCAAYADFLIESFEVLLRDSRDGARMMSVGLHPRVVGHPGRAAALERFVDHIKGREGVWIAKRADIAAHWREVMPPEVAK